MKTNEPQINYSVITVSTKPVVQLHVFNKRAIIKGYAVDNPQILRRCCRLADDAKLDLEIDAEYSDILTDSNFFDIDEGVWLRVYMS